jgi:YD repeat-containing protein
MKRKIGINLAFLTILLLAQPAWPQTGGTVQYFYDDLGRLTKVIDPSGNVATYSYDAVGNLLSITRSTLPANNGLAVLSFAPQASSSESPGSRSTRKSPPAPAPATPGSRRAAIPRPSTSETLPT